MKQFTLTFSNRRKHPHYEGDVWVDFRAVVPVGNRDWIINETWHFPETSTPETWTEERKTEWFLHVLSGLMSRDMGWQTQIVAH